MLGEYRSKRDFAKTREPQGKIESGKTEKPVYVVQKHSATRLHYDLRLEMEGVLKSWAIPKGPPLEEGIKRLAVETEDHPLDYANFEGEIPEGAYGAGKVEIWDRGHYIPREIEDDKIIVEINGEKLKGVYCLIKTRFIQEQKSWLFYSKIPNERGLIFPSS